jgi:hypothetical protein
MLCSVRTLTVLLALNQRGFSRNISVFSSFLLFPFSLARTPVALETFGCGGWQRQKCPSAHQARDQ